MKKMITFERQGLKTFANLSEPRLDPSPNRLLTRRAPCVAALTSRSASTVAVPKCRLPYPRWCDRSATIKQLPIDVMRQTGMFIRAELEPIVLATADPKEAGCGEHLQSR